MKSNPERDRYVGLCAPFTMTQPPRLQFLWNCIEFVDKYDLDGALVEAGVYKGGSSMLMAYALKHLGRTNQLILFDTFTGMTKPSDKDVKREKGNMYHGKWKEAQRDGYTDWCYAPIEEVKANLRKTKYGNVYFLQGDVLDTVPVGALKNIALLRLDTDFYESTAHLLKHLYPLVQDGGFVIFDDYYCWEGAKAAVDEYFAAHNLNKGDIVQVDHSCAVYQKGGQR